MRQKKALAHIHQNPSTKQKDSHADEELSPEKDSVKGLEYANEDEQPSIADFEVAEES